MSDSELSELLGVLVGVVIGVFVVWKFILPRIPGFKDKKTIKDYAKSRLMDDLRQSGRLTIPEILGRAGVADSFMNRGSIAIELGKLCIARRVIEETPEGCPLRERVVKRTYRLA
jgi:hypothetical protein